MSPVNGATGRRMTATSRDCRTRSRARFFQRAERPLVTLAFHDVHGDGVWQVDCDGVTVGVVVRPFSVVTAPPAVFVALPRDATCLAAGTCAPSLHEAVDVLLSAADV